MPHLSWTRKDIKIDVVRVFGARDDVSWQLAKPGTMTAGGSTTTLLDSLLSRGTIDANMYDGMLCEALDSAAGDAVRSARVDASGFASPATLTLSPAITDGWTSGEQYLPYPSGLTPAMVEEAASMVLRSTHGRRFWAPSLVVNGEFSGTGNFNDIDATDATNTFVSTAGNLYAPRRLNTQTTGSGDGWASDAFDVKAGENLLVSLRIEVPEAVTVSVVLYNATASAAIKTVTLTQRHRTEVKFQGLIPASCEQASIRVTADGVGNPAFVTYAPIVVQSDRRRSYVPYGSFFRAKEQFISATTLPSGPSAVDADTYHEGAVSEGASVPVSIVESVFGYAPVVAEFSRTTNDPVVLAVQAEFDDMTLDTDGSHIDREYLTAMMVSHIKKLRGDLDWVNWHHEALKMGSGPLGYGKRDFQVRPNSDYVTAGRR